MLPLCHIYDDCITDEVYTCFRRFTVPDHSGVYPILQGTVEKLSMDPETKTLTSDIVRVHNVL